MKLFINSPDGDRELRTAATTWLGLWNNMQEKCRDDENYIVSDAECKVANAHFDKVLRIRAKTFESIAVKAAILSALDGNSDRLALGLCSDIQRLGRD